MFYRVAKIICRVILFLVRRWKVTGNAVLPSGQGMIVVANHVSYWDPVVVGCALNRRIFFMAKAELFKIPGLGFIIKNLGAFPVQREGVDRSSIKRALDLLAAGEVVGIFPEGTRSKTGELLNPHLGAAMLAIKGGVPLLPVAVSGTKGFLGQVKVVIGKPMNITACNRRKVSRDEMAAVSRDIMSEIGRLLAVVER
ncbi:1-acyl-sn-glycerol-3-phosphate acyltransferase [Desulfallas sp. Bu1-1]|jgi:1-acyl-sn-glycerol-3-phosphate acyltransferase|uniref:lysophospholipid acyltransferase family protein n=1 Tax=Desulfallas sp. Bu1-1 TaxID=2787620 RepID=UPI00189DCEFA|nr:lysophospholipid acyltransferase family protein [Desulfallas sp. Bu1-1]MBF7082020.1 1-acyl-sn-glycerol-3-phosphate acyltransferase [Desulfallas sp. Bu1-1]